MKRLFLITSIFMMGSFTTATEPLTRFGFSIVDKLEEFAKDHLEIYQNLQALSLKKIRKYSIALTTYTTLKALSLSLPDEKDRAALDALVQLEGSASKMIKNLIVKFVPKFPFLDAEKEFNITIQVLNKIAELIAKDLSSLYATLA